MKIISIGDLHGEDCWKKIDFSRYDKAVFIGDYTDSFTVSNTQMLKNLEELIALKKSNLEKYVLLLGNHDIHYMFFPLFRCTGYRKEMQEMFTGLYKDNIQLFDIAYQYKNYLFTHAGISKKWFKKYESYFKDLNEKSIAECLKDIFNSEHYQILFEIGAKRGGSRTDTGGIVWADITETQNDYLDGYHQIVGHTPRYDIQTFGGDTQSITYIDVLERNSVKKFYEVIIPEKQIKSI